MNNRNSTLDLLKLLAAYMVVFIHVPFYGEFGIVVRALSRFAVPVFFLTSGYFCLNNDVYQIKRKLIKIVKILIFSSILYNFTNVTIAYLLGGVHEVYMYLSDFRHVSSWIELVIFNVPFSSTRLWFLLALIYVYMMQICLMKYVKKKNVIYIIAIVGLSFNLLFGEIFKIYGIEVKEHYTRNFLLTGYPFLGIGLLFREKQEKIYNTRNGVWILGLILGLILTLISLYNFGETTLCIGSTLVAFSSFAIAIKNDKKQYSYGILRLAECNLGIYIFHRTITTLLSKIIDYMKLPLQPVVLENLLPILVALCSTMLTIFIINIKKQFYKLN